MPRSNVYRPHDEEPARASFRSATAGGPTAGEARSFEFISRGDFVSGALLVPSGAASRPAPLILITLDEGRSETLQALPFAKDWLQRGLALAAIDLPLHGRRASPKLSERLFDGLRQLLSGAALDLDTRALVEEFARQSTSDLIRATDAIGGLPEIDETRMGLFGQGRGALVATYALGHGPAFGAGVVLTGASRVDAPGLDPAAELADRDASLSCPLLVQSLQASGSAKDSLARAIFDAAPDPKEWTTQARAKSENAGGDLHDDAARAAGDFLAKNLGL